jgi:hypothetical protein
MTPPCWSVTAFAACLVQDRTLEGISRRIYRTAAMPPGTQEHVQADMFPSLGGVNRFCTPLLIIWGLSLGLSSARCRPVHKELPEASTTTDTLGERWWTLAVGLGNRVGC